MEEVRLPDWFKEARSRPCPTGKKARTAVYAGKVLRGAASSMRGLLDAGAYSGRPGLIQRTGPAGRLAGTFIIIVSAAVARRPEVLLGLLGLNLALAIASRINPWAVAKRTLPAFVLTLVLALPVFFDFITPGAEIAGLEIGPLRLAVTEEGVSTGLYFILRVVTMVSFVSLAVASTSETEIFSGLRGLPVPAFFTAALFMTYRYLFILLKTVEDAAFARRSRTIDVAAAGDARGWFASRAALVLKRSLKTADDVALAMTSRGFGGRLKTGHAGRLGGADYVWLGAAFFVLFLSLGIGA